MPDNVGVRVGSVMGSDSPQDQRTELKGMPLNLGRDPKSRQTMEKGTIGAYAFQDALMIVIIAWVLLLLLYYSLRHHNV